MAFPKGGPQMGPKPSTGPNPNYRGPSGSNTSFGKGEGKADRARDRKMGSKESKKEDRMDMKGMKGC